MIRAVIDLNVIISAFKPRQSLGYKYVPDRWHDDALSGP